MSDSASIGLSDPRLAAHAASAMPAWLWSSDGSRILWANPNGAEIFRAGTAQALRALRFDPKNPTPLQIARLAQSLPDNGNARLEKLRGFGAGIGGALLCQCSCVTLVDGTSGILIASTERAGPDLPLETRLQRLLADMDEPAAAFSAQGELLQASTKARPRIGGAIDLKRLGAQVLAEQASREGHAVGDTAAGPVRVDRLNGGSVLLLTFLPSPAASQAPPAQHAAPAPDAVSALPAPVREQSLRFLWQTDAAHRLIVSSDDFKYLIGPKIAAQLDGTWPEIAVRLGLDPDGQFAAALGRQTTFSGVVVPWPVEGSGERLAADMSGLPAFDRERNFQGYRGFGIVRDIARLRDIAALRAKAAEPAKPPAPVEPSKFELTATVVPFPVPAEKPHLLSPKETRAFDELARELSDRLKSKVPKPMLEDDFGNERHEPIADAGVETPPPAAAPVAVAASASENERPILDRLPVGLLIYRLNDLIYANRAFLDWTGYPTLDALKDAGGLDSLFIETAPQPMVKNGGKNGSKTLTISTSTGKQLPVQGRLFPTQWNGDSALVLMLNTAPAAEASRGKASELEARRIESESRELKAVLDTATDGVLLIERSGRVLSANRSAEALFGLEQGDFAELSFGDLFAPESKRGVLDYLDRLAGGGTAALLNQGMEVVGRVRRGGLIPLHLTIGQVGETGDKFCAVFRDVTAWKRTEEDLINARRQAEKASAAKSDFLAKISHEIRTPLNAIIGFSEVMMEEQFGPIGNERYKQYLRDIHASGGHLISLLNELLDLSKIEAGKLDLTFVSVNLNDLTQQCVAIMQQQANRERVIIRSALAASLPQIVADARSVRQIVLNLLSNSIKFTGAGGQVIISTALTDSQEVVLRVRDTGAGMTEQELKAALEPFRQLATAARWGSSGTGLGLPITKALTEANHARFKITSAIKDGTLAEVSFPATRVLA